MTPGLLLMIYTPTKIYICVQSTEQHCWTWKRPKWPDKNNSLSTWISQIITTSNFFFRECFGLLLFCMACGRWVLNEVSDWGGECLGCPEFGAQLSLTKGEAATSQRIRSAAAGQLPNSSPSEQLSWEFAQEKNPNWRSRHGCGADRLKRVRRVCNLKVNPCRRRSF